MTKTLDEGQTPELRYDTPAKRLGIAVDAIHPASTAHGAFAMALHYHAAPLEKEIAALKLDRGLDAIVVRQQMDLRESCESALDERDREIALLRDSLKQTAGALDRLTKQADLCDFKDEIGHELKMNAAYLDLQVLILDIHSRHPEIKP